MNAIVGTREKTIATIDKRRQLVCRVQSYHGTKAKE